MTRRLCAALACLALCLGLLAGCASQPQSATVSDNAQRFTAYYFDVFDTMTQVIAYCDSQAEFDRQADALHDDLAAYHKLYDIYNDYEGINNIKTINDNAGVAPVQVDERILDMLELAVETERWRPRELLAAMLGMEAALGRRRDPALRFGPRSIDMDLLLFGDVTSADVHCLLPHPRLCERAFVLVPLAELAPDLVVNGRSIAQWLERLVWRREGRAIFQ